MGAAAADTLGLAENKLLLLQVLSLLGYAGGNIGLNFFNAWALKANHCA